MSSLPVKQRENMLTEYLYMFSLGFLLGVPLFHLAEGFMKKKTERVARGKSASN